MGKGDIGQDHANAVPSGSSSGPQPHTGDSALDKLASDSQAQPPQSRNLAAHIRSLRWTVRRRLIIILRPLNSPYFDFSVADIPVRIQETPPGYGFGTTSMILGMTSIPFCWAGYLEAAMIMTAIIFGILARDRAQAADDFGAGIVNRKAAGIISASAGAVVYLSLGIWTHGATLVI